MTTQMLLDHRASCVAEQAGDAFAAGELHARVPMFRRSGHQVVLRHLDGLSEEMTPWLWARWAAYQTTRLDGTSSTARIGREALAHVVPTLYDDDMARTYDRGGDHVSVLARVLAQSWALHQVSTYDLGGLRSFLVEHARGRLAEESGLARGWCLAPMGGYRIVDTDRPGLWVRGLGGRSEHELLDLGARTHAPAGAHVIGRLVPTGTAPALMFDTRPLPVDEDTARAVAARPMPLDWLDVLADACDDGRVDRTVIDSEDRELASDVAGLMLLDRATPPSRREEVRRSLANGRDEIGRAAFRVLDLVARGEWGSGADANPATDAAYVAAAVVNPRAHAEAWRLLLTRTPACRWDRWAALVPDPARARLLHLAAAAQAAS